MLWNTQIISEQTFPDNLKLAHFAPVFKKKDSNVTKNYSPVIALPILCEMFERQH